MTYKAIVLTSFLLTVIADIVVRLNSFVGQSNGATQFVTVLNLATAICLLTISAQYNWKDKLPSKALLVYMSLMAWSLFAFIRGMVNAQDYWDWKILLFNYLFQILVPFALVLGINFEVTTRMFRFILDKFYIVALAFVPISLSLDYELYPRVVSSVSLLILFLPYLKMKWKLFIVVVAVISVAMDVSYRVNVLRILFPTLLIVIYVYRNYFSTLFLNLFSSLLFVLPLIFLFLGVNGHFNVFNEQLIDIEVGTVNDNSGEVTNLAADTRTLLYKEVINSMIMRDSSFVIGEGGGAAYETEIFSHITLNDRGRYNSEVGFLNVLLYAGFIGVILYASALAYAVYYAINHSRNFLCKLLGLFLAFHWVIFFIEDIPRMDLNCFVIWIAVGLCFSNRFRALTDQEVRNFLRLSKNNVAKGAVKNLPTASRFVRLVD